ncbi:DUF6114 domain-containing protein [Streptomyces sp. NBC_00414]|uniref:DUF6114 domain-containing protein n=1 Tax=Streptomyces sp. NBC_00414 TaxID=2975739 RepID=UPI002E24EEBF
MFSFVLGFLWELAREIGDRLDRILPAPRLRRSLRGWRRRRPFWAAVWVISGGVEMVAIPLAPLPLMIRVGVGAMSAVGISLVLIAGGVFFLFRPDQRMFVSVVTAIASLTSLATTNLGGFGIGMTAGLIGSSMAFGWQPHRVRGEHEEGGRPKAAARTAAHLPHTGPIPEADAPKAREDRAPSGNRRISARRAVLFAVTTVIAVIAVTVVTALVATASRAVADRDIGTTRMGTTRVDDEGPQVTLPCLTGVDTGGLPDPEAVPEATPGETSDDLSALRPPIVVGDRPGRPRATYPVSPAPPEVGADTLTAYGAVIHGATYLPTVAGGRMKVLWVHADRLVADDYAFRLEAGDQVQTIDVDLDIPQVDIYVTRLTGSLTIPVIGVGTPRICVGADVVPANLPIAVRLPELSVTAVEAGQVLVDAETVNFTDLKVHSRHR